MWCFRRTTIAKRRRWTIQLLEMRTCKQKEAFLNINWKNPNPKIKMCVLFCLSPPVLWCDSSRTSADTDEFRANCIGLREVQASASAYNIEISPWSHWGKQAHNSSAPKPDISYNVVPVFCFVIEKPICRYLFDRSGHTTLSQTPRFHQAKFYSI